jgi:hypothetical protein
MNELFQQFEKLNKFSTRENNNEKNCLIDFEFKNKKNFKSIG